MVSEAGDDHELIIRNLRGMWMAAANTYLHDQGTMTLTGLMGVSLEENGLDVAFLH